MMKHLPLKIFSILAGAAIAIPSHAQWNSSTSVNTMVCNATGQQIDLRMCDDGKKGVFIVWKDYRAGVPDVYAQHVDSLGIPKWTANGVAVCTQSADQSTPAIISDGNGGVIISWSDWRTGIERDLYAQRLNANGVPMWTTNGVIVSNKNEREHNQRMVSDGNGGAIIIFENQSQMTWSWEVWGQRINSSGNTMWTPGGVKLTNLNVEFLNPRVQGDNKGGVFVTWQDFRNGIDYDVYVQRVGPTGNLLWGPTAKLACNVSGTQTNPKIDPDSASGGVIVAWTDKRNGFDYDLYAQKFDSLGNLMWGNGGAAVCTAAGNQSAVDIFSKPETGGTIFTWKDGRAGATNYDIYAQKLNSNGVAQWVTNGIAICNSSNDQLNPNITGDGVGGAVICWQDLRTTPSYDVYAQRITKNGAILWAANGVPVATASGNQGSPKNISDGDGGTIVAWEDTRNGNPDIYAHKIFYDGFNVGLPEENHLAFLNCYPNPFSGEINISYLLLKNDRISIKLYNVIGEEVADLGNGSSEQNAGMHTVSADANGLNLSSGIYFVKISGKEFSVTKKLVRE